MLPYIRGADGLLWSLLLRGKPGATAFYMSPGLDTGDIILATNLDIPPIPAGLSSLDVATAYRMLYCFVDPMLRANLLRRIIDESVRQDFSNLRAVSQRQEDGVTFHFMNKHMRQLTFQRLEKLADSRKLAESGTLT